MRSRPALRPRALCLLLVALLALAGANASAAQDDPILVTLSVASAFTQRGEVPISWVEVLVFYKDPTAVEFFERPDAIAVGQSKVLLKLRAADLAQKRLWVLYRLDESVPDRMRRGDVDQERMYESFKDAVWMFAVPYASTLDQITIHGARLTYALKDGGSRVVAGSAFKTALPRYGARKGGGGFVRIDNRPEVDFGGLAATLNPTLPATAQIDAANTRVWGASANLYVAPQTISGQRYFGPRGHDRRVVERGYTPIFIVIQDSPEEVVLRSDRPWLAVHPATVKGIVTDLRRDDPALWSSLPAEVKARYQVPTAIRPGTETRLIVFWKADGGDAGFPRYFLMFARRPSGEDLRTVVFVLAPAQAR